MFDLLKKKHSQPEPLKVKDTEIVAMADGDLYDITQVSDPVFAQKIMGDGVAFRYAGDRAVICAPANGVLSVLFPTGHAFGVTMANGVELLVHIGIDSVNAKGDGFRLMGKQQNDHVKAGEPIVEADLKKLGAKYDMSTMLVVTETKGQTIQFIDPCHVVRGQKLTKE